MLKICKAVGQLRESHRQELIKAGKPSHLEVSCVTPDAYAELSHREKIHKLGKNASTFVHAALLKSRNAHSINENQNQIDSARKTD